jgi:thiol-disulfide isomerase/thioredoxin
VNSRVLLAAAFCLTQGACHRAPPPDAGATGPSPAAASGLVAGTYRAVLRLPGGELPFGFSVGTHDGKPIVYLLNGAESVPVTEIEANGGTFVLRMPGYANRIELAPDATGYRGAAVMVRRGGGEVRLPFAATAGEHRRFFADPTPDPPQIAGRWSVTLRDRAGTTTPAIAEFEQSGARVVGTFLAPDGDHRFLEGELHGEELWLSRFDGGSAFLYHGRLGADGTLSGKLWSGSWSVDDWTARRDAGAALTDPATPAGSKLPEHLSFAFPDLDGRIVSLADERFRGKVVIVSLGGSWCPNCHDEAAFLVPLYRELHAAGLEVVSLEFEHFGDFAAAAAANRRFVASAGIEWPVLIAGVSDRDDAARKLPMLGRVYAFPTTAVVDRRGHVRALHSGFAGPATGQHYDDFKTEFSGRIRALLAEKA